MEDLCIVCNTSVRARQHGVQCDSCKMWQHRTCGTGISLGEYRAAVRGRYIITYISKTTVSITLFTVYLLIHITTVSITLFTVYLLIHICYFHLFTLFFIIYFIFSSFNYR